MRPVLLERKALGGGLGKWTMTSRGGGRKEDFSVMVLSPPAPLEARQQHGYHFPGHLPPLHPHPGDPKGKAAWYLQCQYKHPPALAGRARVISWEIGFCLLPPSPIQDRHCTVPLSRSMVLERKWASGPMGSFFCMGAGIQAAWPRRLYPRKAGRELPFL